MKITMKLCERIRQVRKEKRLSMVKLQERLKEIFGESALRYNTLYRIEKGLREARVSSLTQICAGLGVSLKELKEGTDQEISALIDVMPKKEKSGQYVYSERAAASILSKEKSPFLALRLVLEPGGKTRLEQDPPEMGRFEKWLYCLRGVVTCCIGRHTLHLKKDDALCFESTLPHHFENRTRKKASCIVVQNPKHV